jgi:RNA polymerase sigma-70 factor (ECF subfamily)
MRDDFERAVIAEIPRLRRYARGLLRDAEAADDLVQETLLRALRGRAGFTRPDNLRAWLFTILLNIRRNELRSLARRPRIVPLDDMLAPPGRDGAQEPSAELRRVLAALAELSEELREALLLVAVEGLSYRETAEVLAVPIGTVMSRLHRARKRLRAVQEEAQGLRVVK